MILTLSPNNAVDRILFVDEIEPATTMRAQRMIDHVGGKGLDTSIALSCLGVPTLGLGFVGGHNGRVIVEALERLGVTHELIWLEGESRIAHVIVETRRHRHSHVSPPALAGPGTPPLRRRRCSMRRAQGIPRRPRSFGGCAWVIRGPQRWAGLRRSAPFRCAPN